MKIRLVISLAIFGSFAFLSQTVLADDLSDLKSAHQKMLSAVNAGDVQGIFEVWKDGDIWIPDTLGFPAITTEEEGIRMFSALFKTHIYMVRWHKVDYRVIGNTGLVWGIGGRQVINKTTGVGKRTFFKGSLVFVNSEGKWGCVMEHITPIQGEVDIF